MNHETEKPDRQVRIKQDAPPAIIHDSTGQAVLLFTLVFICALPVLYLVMRVGDRGPNVDSGAVIAMAPEIPEAELMTYDDLPPGVGSNAERPVEPDFLQLSYEEYQVVKGDTVSEIAKRCNLTQDTVLSFNDIKNSRRLQIGQTLKLPNQDGIIHLVAAAETVDAIAERYGLRTDMIRSVNKLESIAEPEAGSRLFLPSARLERVTLQEINGDLFKWPVKGYVSSKFGYRNSPFTGVRQFHSGLDIAAVLGSAAKAAMDGRVASTGFDVNSGNYIVLSHHSGYRTFYGHLDSIKVKVGQQVKIGEKIGEVGSTGLSTGSHLHFTVFKNGTAVDPKGLMN